MSRFGVRCRVTLIFPDQAKWFTNKALVEALVAPLLATDLAEAFTHAGKYGEEKKLKGGVDGLRKALAPGKSSTYAALDAPELVAAKVSTSWWYDADQLEMQYFVEGEPLAARAATILDDAEKVIQAMIEAARPHGGVLAVGHVAPEAEPFRYPRPRPPVSHPALDVTSLLEVFDDQFHASDLDDVAPALIAQIAAAAVPSFARKRRHDDLLVLRWLLGPVDEQSAALAAGRHARWLSQHADVKRSTQFNELGDANETPPQRQPRPPFTFFDPAKGRAYKAIIVDPNGEPDDEVWNETVSAMKSLPPDVKEVRLVVPLRELAVAVLDRARSAGFGAVLYPDDQNRLWNIAPAGWWIDDEDPVAESGSRRR